MHLFLKKTALTLIAFALAYCSSAQVVINEVFVSPTSTSLSTTNANSLYNTDPADLPASNKEWIELYNSSPCDTIDLSCFTLASNMEPETGSGYSNWGAFTFPAGTKILPLHFMIVGGNASNVPLLDFNLNTYRQTSFGSQYLDGDPTRWFLRDEYGWIALYNPAGTPVDAVYWDIYGNPSNLYSQSEYQSPITTTTSCNGILSLPAAVSISGIEYGGMVIANNNFSLQRTSDGASTWFSSATVPSPRDCNSDCISPPVLSFSIIDETCAGNDGSATVNVVSGSNPPFTIEWISPIHASTATINGLTHGDYIVKVTDNTGCLFTIDTAHVDRTDGPAITATNIKDESCTAANGHIYLTVTGNNLPITYQWNNAACSGNMVNNLSAGLYSVTITDAAGCTESMSYNMPDHPGPVVQITSVTNEMCSESNGAINCVTTGGTAPLTWIWNGNAAINMESPQNLSAGSYHGMVSDSNGCNFSIDTSLSDTPPPVVSFINVINEKCNKSDGSATLHITGGAPPYTIVWQEFPGSSDTLLQNLHQGIYHVTVSDSFCSLSREVEIINIPGPLAGFRVYPLSTTIDDPHITFYDESVGATEWYWDFGDNRYSNFQSPSHDYRDSGMFKVVQMISDDQGCMDSVSHTVLIIGPILLWIPNAFSPNGDGLNDRFEIYGQHLTDYELYIYDRWGEAVFHTKDPMTYWDGTYKGKVCEGGVYSWVLWYREDYELFTMDRKVTYGSVTIYR